MATGDDKLPSDQRAVSRLPLLAIVAAVVVLALLLSRSGRVRHCPVVVGDISGTVEFRRPAGEWQPASPGQELLPGRDLHTGPASTALLQWPDATRALLHERSTLHLEQSRVGSRRPDLLVVARLNLGHISVRSLRSNAGDVSFRAVTSVLFVQCANGVFDLRVEPDQASRASVYAGRVLAGPPGHPMTLRAKQAISVGATGQTIQVAPLSARDKTAWEQCRDITHPKLTVLWPRASKRLSAGPLVVQGTAEAKCQVHVNGRATPTDSLGNFVATIDGSAAPQLEIEVVATDIFGNRRSLRERLMLPHADAVTDSSHEP